jgi:hypothetical protein
MQHTVYLIRAQLAVSGLSWQLKLTGPVAVRQQARTVAWESSEGAGTEPKSWISKPDGKGTTNS